MIEIKNGGGKTLKVTPSQFKNMWEIYQKNKAQTRNAKLKFGWELTSENLKHENGDIIKRRTSKDN